MKGFTGMQSTYAMTLERLEINARRTIGWTRQLIAAGQPQR